jgi:hypothetical protein
VNRTAQRARNAEPQPLWLRLGVLFCVLLVCSAGIAQAAHIHGDWLPHHAAQAGTAVAQAGLSDEESCPLCIAMHSAMPVTGFTALALAPFVVANFARYSGRRPDTPWYFAAFSRPPPNPVIL